MRSVEVYRNGVPVGILTEINRERYIFRYNKEYILNPDNPPVSLTLPITTEEYTSKYLFPFFYNLLSEGVNKKVQCRHLQIDEEDHFGLLMAAAQYDTTGAVTVKPLEVK